MGELSQRVVDRQFIVQVERSLVDDEPYARDGVVLVVQRPSSSSVVITALVAHARSERVFDVVVRFDEDD